MSSSNANAIPDNAFCLGCGYALRGLTENRCPECDREFDPTKRWTIVVGRPMTKLARWLLKPPGWIFLGATMLAAGTALWSHTPPDPYFESSLIAFGLWVVLGGIWMLSGLAFAITNAAYDFIAYASPRFKWDIIRWLAFPASVVLVLILNAVEAPHRIACVISYPAMQALVEDYNNGQLPDVEWVGLFPVSSIDTTSQGFSFEIPCGFMDSYGFEYAPQGAKDSQYPRTYRHYRDDWYYYEESF